jgi:hypothetical protein
METLMMVRLRESSLLFWLSLVQPALSLVLCGGIFQ